MERVGEWRVIEEQRAVSTEASPPPSADDGQVMTRWRRTVAVMAATVLTVAGVAIWLTLPEGGVRLDVAGQASVVEVPAAPGVAVAAGPPPEPPIVVDVEGAVDQPGVHQLLAGSRVADAIEAAGGYGADIDIAAAAQLLNLAERLTDGLKIHVPRRGEQAQPAPAADVAAPAQGLIDINRASSTELESLPGIGPVTAAKIIAARQEQPFASVDELDARNVVGPSTLDEIRDLITVAP